jgi:ABC-type nitrate/sulfonate/bicarbonate transport system permease component
MAPKEQAVANPAPAMNAATLPARQEKKSAGDGGPRGADPQSAADRLRRHYPILISVLSVIVFLAVWEWASDTNLVNPTFCSSPRRIWDALSDLQSTGQLWPNVWTSLQEFGWGFLLAIVVAIPLGILIGWYRPVEAIFDPFVTFLNAVPRVALLPVLIIWIGIGIDLKIAVVFLGAVIAILINTITGIKSLDPQLLTMAKSFGASDFKIFRTIALPGSVPYILSGIRSGLGHALTGVVVGELYASTTGVGHLISVAGNTFQIDLVFAGVVIIAVLGLVSTWILARIERRFQSWRQTAVR